MFEFFKDVYAEINGLDSDKIREEKRNTKNQMVKEKKIFNRTTKIIITVVGVLYLVLSFINISVIIRNGFTPMIVKYVLLSMLSIVVMIIIHFKKKEFQIASLIGIAVFIIVNFTFKNN